MEAATKKKKQRKQRWNDCNVIQVFPDLKRLWHFSVAEKQVVQKAKLNHSGETPIPPKQVEQTWRQFLQKRLNIAWLPAEHIFLRIVNLPKGEDLDETKQMLEFQLEKLSPVPVSQIVWSFEILPCPDPTQQTVLLALAESSSIEKLLGDLEESGFQTDRIESPLIHPLSTATFDSDCVRVHLQEHDEDFFDCMISWHINGWTQHVGLSKLPKSDQGAKLLIDNLNNTAWSGELEGWLSEAPALRFVGGEHVPSSWLEAAKGWTSKEIHNEPAPEEDEQAQVSAERATRSLSTTNLMLEDLRTKYRQQYIDGLWMSSLGGVAMVYIFGVLIYFVALEWRRGDNIELQTGLRSKANSYTNTMQLQAKVNILQEQVDLKYSALDCLKVISEMMPDGMSLLSFNFRQGKVLTLRGKVPTDESIKVTDYHGFLIDAKVGEKPLFSSVSDPTISNASSRRKSAENPTSTWSFNCELRRSGFE
ncbi:MAG: hypothetical protein ISQ73_13265 [Verrucomicrobiae bacterium]|nr:hypothetical protein [Verrucomicrobiae bacterium]